MGKRERNARLHHLLGGAAGLAGLLVANLAAAQETSVPLENEDEIADQKPGNEILVTGSRIARGGFDAPSPVTVLGSDRLEKLAQTDLGDALNQIPSFRATLTPQTSNIYPANIGGRFADLRGLGPQRTLVLVNGRRFPASTALNTVDLNLIPIALVNRTEVVTGGASAAYGSDAVAGVVNIILDQTYEGVRGTIQGGISEHGDDEKYLASLAAGTRLFEGRGHLVVGGEIAESDGVGACYMRAYCRASPGTINNPNPGANGLPALLMLRGTRAATLAPGGLIVSPDALAGIQFDANANPMPFEFGDYWSPTALFMVGGDGTVPNAYFHGNAIAPEVDRYSLFGQMNYDLGGGIEAFAELSYGKVKGRSPSALGIRGVVTIQQDNPFIPDSIREIMANEGITSFRLGREGIDFGRAINHSSTGTLRAAVGLSGELFGNWTWDTHYQLGNTDYHQTTRGAQISANLARAVDAVGTVGEPVCRINADADPTNDDPACAPLNLFGLNNWSPEAAEYVFGDTLQENRFRQHLVAANLRGSPFSTWAGEVSLAAGAEYRSEDVDGDADPISQALGFWHGPAVKIAGESEVVEGYVEAAVPLLRDAPLAQNFELNGAIRRTGYSFRGDAGESSFSVTTWKLGAIFETGFGLLLRATRSRDIRAPNVSELYSTSSTFSTVVNDPAQGIAVNVPTLVAANPNLTAEIADSLTAGVTFQPEFAPGLRLSVDYFDIATDGAISRPGTQTVVNRCFSGAIEFCQFVTRGANGELTQVVNPLYNFSRMTIEGIDFEAAYGISLAGGRLDAQLLATYVAHYTTTDSAGTIDRAGQTGFPASQIPGMPHWTADAVVSYSYGPASVSLQAHFIDSGYHDVTRIGPDDPEFDPALPNSVNVNRLRARTYFNLAGELEVMRGIEVFGAVENLFDISPPSIHSGNYGTNAILFDPIGRRFKAGMRFAF